MATSTVAQDGFPQVAHVLSNLHEPSFPQESILKNIGFPMTVDGSGNSVSRDIVMKEFDASAATTLNIILLKNG